MGDRTQNTGHTCAIAKDKIDALSPKDLFSYTTEAWYHAQLFEFIDVKVLYRELSQQNIYIQDLKAGDRHLKYTATCNHRLVSQEQNQVQTKYVILVSREQMTIYVKPDLLYRWWLTSCTMSNQLQRLHLTSTTGL